MVLQCCNHIVWVGNDLTGRYLAEASALEQAVLERVGIRSKYNSFFLATSLFFLFSSFFFPLPSFPFSFLILYLIPDLLPSVFSLYPLVFSLPLPFVYLSSFFLVILFFPLWSFVSSPVLLFLVLPHFIFLLHCSFALSSFALPSFYLVPFSCPLRFTSSCYKTCFVKVAHDMASKRLPNPQVLLAFYCTNLSLSCCSYTFKPRQNMFCFI